MENLRFGHKIMKRVKDMGMYDELLITRTYLKDLLTKEQEKVLKSHDNVYQTKSLENGLYKYRVHRRKLWKDDSSFNISEKKQEEVKKPNWVEVKKSVAVEFYTEVIVDGNSHWYEFFFTFVNGKIDTKELTDYSTRSKAELDKEEEQWQIIKSYYDSYRAKFFVRVCEFISRKLMSISDVFSKKTVVPESIKQRAFKAAGKEYKGPFGF